MGTATVSSFLNVGTAGGWSAWPERVADHLFYWYDTRPGWPLAAFEQPGLLVTELRDCFRALR